MLWNSFCSTFLRFVGCMALNQNQDQVKVVWKPKCSPGQWRHRGHTDMHPHVNKHKQTDRQTDRVAVTYWYTPIWAAVFERLCVQLCTHTPLMVTFQVPILSASTETQAHPSPPPRHTAPFICLIDWYYQAAIMIDWACFSRRGWCHLITVCPSVLLLFFCLSVSVKPVTQSACLLSQPPSLPAWFDWELGFSFRNTPFHFVPALKPWLIHLQSFTGQHHPTISLFPCVQFWFHFLWCVRELNREMIFFPSKMLCFSLVYANACIMHQRLSCCILFSVLQFCCNCCLLGKEAQANGLPCDHDLSVGSQCSKVSRVCCQEGAADNQTTPAGQQPECGWKKQYHFFFFFFCIKPLQ